MNNNSVGGSASSDQQQQHHNHRAPSQQRRRGSAGAAGIHRQRSQRRQASFRKAPPNPNNNHTHTHNNPTSQEQQHAPFPKGKPRNNLPNHHHHNNNNDGFGQIATRRASTGMTGFDPFDVGNMASLNAALQKKQQQQQQQSASFGSFAVQQQQQPATRSSNNTHNNNNSSSDDTFDPFSTTALDKVNQKRLEGLRKAQGMNPQRRHRPAAPPRSASIGSISKQDLEDFAKTKPQDDDLGAFDDVDWGNNNNNNTESAHRFQSRSKSRAKSTSRRHSMDSSGMKALSKRSIMTKVDEHASNKNDDDDGFGEIFKAIKARGPSEQQQQQQRVRHPSPRKDSRKASGKSRRQSLDSALAKTAAGNNVVAGGDDDGFGEVKSFGFGGDASVVSGISSGSAERPGMVRRNSVSRSRHHGAHQNNPNSDAVSIASWKSAESGGSGGAATTTSGRSAAAPTRRGLNRRRSADLSARRLSASGGMTMKPVGSGEFDYETETTATPSTRGESPVRTAG